MKDIIIVGRGLTGATLSFELINRGIAHTIYDQPSISSSSKVAAGLVNPIVLKRLKMVQDADKFMSLIPDHYQQLENLTETNFYHPATIDHIYSSVGEQNQWEEKKDLDFHSHYLKEQKSATHPTVNAPLGVGVMKNAGWLNTQSYLSAHSSYSKSQNIAILEEDVELSDIDLWINQGKTVILCTGHLLRHWKLLPEDVFTPTRGEVMTIKTSELPPDVILHSSVFTIPLGDDLFKVGATYHWDNLDDTPTNEGLSKLRDDFEKMFTGTYEVVEHQAGVRPNIKDRKPIIGEIKPNLHTFNGMGSRAALMTPFLAKMFVNHLVDQSPIPNHFNINRFLKK